MMIVDHAVIASAKFLSHVDTHVDTHVDKQNGGPTNYDYGVGRPHVHLFPLVETLVTA